MKIMQIIMEGLVGLIIIYCNYVTGDRIPLLPWYHSTEACEHTFGKAWSIVKDFTYLDFLYMVPKLNVRMHKAVLGAKISDPNKTAGGYCHTYFDNSAEEAAAEEAKSLMLFIGVPTLKLSQKESMLPTIDSWFQEEVEPELDSEESECNVEELQRMIELAEDVSRSPQSIWDEKILASLTCTAIMLVVDDFSTIQNLLENDPDKEEAAITEDYMSIQTVLNGIIKLPVLQIPTEPSKPLPKLYESGMTSLTVPSQWKKIYSSLTTGQGCETRTQHTHNEKKKQADNSVVESVPPLAGNAKNALVAAKKLASMNLKSRSNLFQIAGFAPPLLLNLHTVCISSDDKLHLHDFGFIFTNNAVKIGKVVVIYTETGGIHEQHASSTETENISTNSYIGIQVFEPFNGFSFTILTDNTAHFRT
ncbi:hypothetical protein BDQ17DRAFT_1433488 [Cyathus striatus]|nr:hypothetical protein BDQ17DRAFT_1433488 [Cyathus striatus]